MLSITGKAQLSSSRSTSSSSSVKNGLLSNSNVGPGMLRGGAGDGGAKTTCCGISPVGPSVVFNASPMLLIASAGASLRVVLIDSSDLASAPDGVFSAPGVGSVSAAVTFVLPEGTT